MRDVYKTERKWFKVRERAKVYKAARERAVNRERKTQRAFKWRAAPCHTTLVALVGTMVFLLCIRV